jgi:3-hydroxybutyryl-CoA dehydratase
MSYMRDKAIEGLHVGDTFSVSRTFRNEDVLQFAEISRDYNPVHSDERFAKVKNFMGPVCQGLLVASLVTEIGGQIGWLASGMDFKFLKPVYFGNTIKCDFTIIDIGDGGNARGEGIFTNDDGATVLIGVITGFIPGDKEKQVMKAMVEEGDPTNKVSREDVLSF